jgi:hypothetical protein
LLHSSFKLVNCVPVRKKLVKASSGSADTCSLMLWEKDSSHMLMSLVL